MKHKNKPAGQSDESNYLTKMRASGHARFRPFSEFDPSKRLTSVRLIRSFQLFFIKRLLILATDYLLFGNPFIMRLAPIFYVPRPFIKQRSADRFSFFCPFKPRKKIKTI